MKIILVGAGLVGTHVARELTQEHKDIIIIEKNSETARIITNELDCMVINDDGSRLDVLQKVGIEDCDYFIALTGSDEVNMIACGMVASQYKNTKTIARVRNPYYGMMLNKHKSFLGIHHVINPEIEAADAIVRSIEEGVSKDVFSLIEDRVQMRLHRIVKDSRFAGKTIQQIRKEVETDFLIPVLNRENSMMIPTGDTIIQEGDELYFLGNPNTLDKILGQSLKRKHPVHKIGIIGGTRIGEFVIGRIRDLVHEQNKGLKRVFSSFLKRPEVSITVLEASKEKAKALSQLFPDITIINRDIGEEDVLEQEEFSKHDVVITVTESQTLNLVSAMMAKHIGAKNTIALVINNSFLKLSSSLQIDHVVSLKTAVVNSILRIIRKANIETIHTFYQDDFELLRLTLAPNAKPVGKPIKDLNLPKDALILLILRGSENIVPSGSTVLQAGDLLGLIAKKDVISKLETIFESTDEL
ncbi:MAG: Trk system potassium transport protein TrkA [Spirochaetes bacterium]|nr:Trk system potassium transport protein TrkA [Spirochaetota bacterium]